MPATGTAARPRARLRRQFVDRYRIATVTGRPAWALAHVAGFPNQQDLSNTVYARELSLTPLVRRRLERLADAIGYPAAEMFEEER